MSQEFFSRWWKYEWSLKLLKQIQDYIYINNYIEHLLGNVDGPHQQLKHIITINNILFMIWISKWVLWLREQVVLLLLFISLLSCILH